MSADPLLQVLGGLLLFVLPGFAVAKATFPEWRVRGPEGWVGAVRLAASSLVLSVALVVLVGFGLLNTPAGFQATWSDPTLEVALGAITAVALAVAAFRGGFSSRVPSPPAAASAEEGEDGAWPLLRRLEANRREQRRLRHSLRTGSGETADARRAQELHRLEEEERRLVSRREEAYVR